MHRTANWDGGYKVCVADKLKDFERINATNRLYENTVIPH